MRNILEEMNREELIDVKAYKQTVLLNIDTLQGHLDAPESMPTDEGYGESLTDALTSVETQIYSFDPRNPDNVATVVNERYQQIMEHQKAMMDIIQSS